MVRYSYFDYYQSLFYSFRISYTHTHTQYFCFIHPCSHLPITLRSSPIILPYFMPSFCSFKNKLLSVLPVCTFVWRHPLQHRQLTRSHIREETKPPYPSSLQLPRQFSFYAGIWWPESWANLVQAATAAVSVGVPWSRRHCGIALLPSLWPFSASPL